MAKKKRRLIGSCKKELKDQKVRLEALKDKYQTSNLEEASKGKYQTLPQIEKEIENRWSFKEDDLLQKKKSLLKQLSEVIARWTRIPI